MNKVFKLGLITLPIAAIGAGILAFVVSNSPPPARVELAERAYAVRVITAQTMEITPSAVGFGLVSPARTFAAIAEVSGTVEYLHPDLRYGQILPAGAVLLRLAPVDFNLAIAQANANIRAAQARLTELDVAESNQRAALEIEQEALEVKASDLARAEALFTAGTMTQTARDAVRAAYLVQRQKVQGAQSAVALIPTQREVQAEQIAIYQTTLATAQRNLDRSELTLPFAARVAAHSVEVGQFLSVGHTAATLDSVDVAEVEVQLPLQTLRSLMRPDPTQSLGLPMDPTQLGIALRDRGLSAEVRLLLGEEQVRWPATVDRISDEIDQRSGTVGVVVRVDNPYSPSGDGLRPPLTKGMFVDVALSAQPIAGVVIPRSALHGGLVHVVDDDNRLHILAATPQLMQGGIALFTDGIEDGTHVVLSTPDPVVEGLLMDPHPDTTLMPQLLEQDATQ
jgi:multidrug efflux pump subunit AcrA (membrane-fusion protein)